MSIRDKFSRFVLVVLLLGPVILYCSEEAPVAGLDDVRELILDGEYEQAEVSCRALLAQVEESRGADSFGTATVLDALVESCRSVVQELDLEPMVLARDLEEIEEQIDELADLLGIEAGASKACELIARQLRETLTTASST